MYGWKRTTSQKARLNRGYYTMTTTGELRAIVEELELVDIGDAATYLGEESAEDDLSSFEQSTSSAAGCTEGLFAHDCFL
jgi:hypothetical protein